MKDLLSYKITIDPEYSEGEDLGIKNIAFTSKPAIKVKGFAFSQETKQLTFSDDLKYRVAGPIMIPMEIYRSDADEEYYVQFTEQEIEDIHSKFMENYSNQDVFNLEHNNVNKVPAYILEAILVDSENKVNMIKQEYNIDVPIGTSFIVSQITDTNYYDELIKQGQVGFSIEGFLGMKLSEMNKIKLTNKPPFHDNCQCMEINGKVDTEPGVCDYCLEQIKDEYTKNKKINMNELNLPAGEYVSADGTIIIIAEDGTITQKQELSLDLPVGEANPGGTASATQGGTASGIKSEKVDLTKEKGDAVEMAVEPVVTDSYTKEELDVKFEELYKLIGGMQAEDDAEDNAEDTKVLPTQLSENPYHAFCEFVRFTSNKIQ